MIVLVVICARYNICSLLEEDYVLESQSQKLCKQETDVCRTSGSLCKSTAAMKCSFELLVFRCVSVLET
jgi:hypothetical protein